MIPEEEPEELMSDVWGIIDAIDADAWKGLSEGKLTVGHLMSSAAFEALSPHDKEQLLQRGRIVRIKNGRTGKPSGYQLEFDASKQMWKIELAPPSRHEVQYVKEPRMSQG